MLRNRTAVLALVRFATLGVTVLSMLLVGPWKLRGLHADLATGLLVLFGVGIALPVLFRQITLVPAVLLGVDLLAIGAAGTFLALPEGPHEAVRASMPFLAGFLVTVLMAATGRRLAAAGAGAVAGIMLLVLGEGVVPHHPLPTPSEAIRTGSTDERAPYDPSGPPESRDTYLVLRLLMLVTAAVECAIVLGWVEAELHRRRMADSVDREMRRRETNAGEIAAFGASASAATGLRDVGEALLLHLRRNFPVRARAFVLEDAGVRLAVWEESGRLDDALVRARQDRLETALHESGVEARITHLDARGIAASGATRVERLVTSVTAPVNVGGRTIGVIHVADPKRDALADDRLGAIAELARTVGDALTRLDRTRDDQARRTSLLLGQMREGVLLLGPDARVLLSNPAGRDMLKTLGCPQETPLALGEMRPTELSHVPAGVVRRTSVSATGAEGRTTRFAVTAMGVADGGTRLGTLITLTDVTEEEQARQRLMQAEKMSVVGQTLASVAHELNNPLAAIVGYADLLGDSEVSPEVARLLTRIREQATRTSRIVRNLLNVARRRGPERTLVAFNEVVTSVVELFAYDAKLSNIHLVTRLDDDLPPIHADRHALQQILVNLVQNAMQAMRARGVGGTVEIATGHKGGLMSLTVADDGPGIAPEARARLFEAFFTTKGPGEGTGLGLAISRGIAREHLGDLVLEDRSDGKPGAQFALRIPISDRPAVAPIADHVIPDGVPARVLVVDDEPAVRDALVAQLGRLGAQVESAATPGEAEVLLTSGAPYDAVLLDIRLQGHSGLDVHRTLRAANPDLADRVVFMTGDLVNDEMIQAVRSTGNTLLEKPFTTIELRRALAKAHGGAT